MCWWKGFDNGISVGRSYRDAPEIDGMVFIEGKLETGSDRPGPHYGGNGL